MIYLSIDPTIAQTLMFLCVFTETELAPLPNDASSDIEGSYLFYHQFSD